MNSDYHWLLTTKPFATPLKVRFEKLRYPWELNFIERLLYSVSQLEAASSIKRIYRFRILMYWPLMLTVTVTTHLSSTAVYSAMAYQTIPKQVTIANNQHALFYRSVLVLFAEQHKVLFLSKRTHTWFTGNLIGNSMTVISSECL